MGSAFAVQVITGKEQHAKKLMEWAFERNETARKWVKAVHTFTQGTRRLLESGKLGKNVERAAMPGYIFIEMNYSQDNNNSSAYLPPELHHLVKSVPFILNVFSRAGQMIGSEVFNDLADSIDMNDQIEVSQDIPDHDNDIKEAVHDLNVASISERADAEAKLVAYENKKLLSEEISELKSAMKELFEIVIKNNKEVIRFPASLFDKVIKNIYDCNQFDKYLTKPLFFLPRLLRYIRSVVDIN